MAGDHSENSQLFEELVHSDLDLRIRNGLPARVEDYIARYPAIEKSPKLLQELIHTEFEIRKLLEPGLDLEELTQRFPSLTVAVANKIKSNSTNKAAVDTGSQSRADSFSDSGARFVLSDQRHLV